MDIRHLDFLTTKPLLREEKSFFNSILTFLILIAVIVYSFIFIFNNWSAELVSSSIMSFPSDGVSVHFKCPDNYLNTSCSVNGQWYRAGEIIQARIFTNQELIFNLTTVVYGAWIYTPLFEVSNDKWFHLPPNGVPGHFFKIIVSSLVDSDQINNKSDYYHSFRVTEHYYQPCGIPSMCGGSNWYCCTLFSFYPEYTIKEINKTWKYDASSFVFSVGEIIALMTTIGLILSKFSSLMKKIAK